jgi:hypothetical protein
MKRPKPLPAVDRGATTKTAAVPVGAGVTPASFWGTLGNIAKTVAPIAAMALL